MTQDWTLEEALAYYRRQGAPGEQGALVALLREVQEERGGALPAADLAEIAAALSLRDTFLSAIIRRYPGLRTEEAPHRLELCGGPRCSGRGAARLAAFVEETYGVRPGGVSASGRFTYRITGCMKNCPNGPSLRWDGALHSRADEALIRAGRGEARREAPGRSPRPGCPAPRGAAPAGGPGRLPPPWPAGPSG